MFTTLTKFHNFDENSQFFTTFHNFDHISGSSEGADARPGGEKPVEQRGSADEKKPRRHRQPKGERTKTHWQKHKVQRQPKGEHIVVVDVVIAILVVVVVLP